MLKMYVMFGEYHDGVLIETESLDVELFENDLLNTSAKYGLY